MAELKLKSQLYSAQAVATGGRNGHTKNSDGLIDANLSIPKAMGGPGKPNTTTPEDLFAAGYAACFGSACEYAAKTALKLNPSLIEIQSTVIIGEEVAGGFALEVHLKAKIAGVSKEDAQKIINTGHQVCPYSKAIKDNVKVTLELMD